MDTLMLLFIVVGLAVFVMAWMPTVSKETGISYSIFYTAGGYLIYMLFPESLPNPLPQQNEAATLHLTELIVIFSLMGAGIKLERRFSLKGWAVPLRLLGIAMLLCIGLTTFLGYFYLGLTLSSAVLLGAALAPTDPVLAADVQVGPPNEKSSSETKFALTAEAGMNDGLAFPFTWLAISFAMLGTSESEGLVHWFTFHLVYKIAIGLALGWMAGYTVGHLLFSFSKKHKILYTRDGFLAIGLTLLVYGITEACEGYGFISTFVCALTMRSYERKHKYHEEMHSFTEQIERLLLAILLILFGGALYAGILDPLDWRMAAFVCLFIFVIRPATAYLSLVGTSLAKKERLAISFFGIRGMGSIFYLAFALGEFEFDSKDELWATLAFAVALSILVHGLSANSVMRKLRGYETNSRSEGEENPARIAT
ncbi:cation:proton antiporter [Algoriphagus aestuariicola]|uniref:Cation:proton antiporter n=1 Tax=Algoriphagus aestuariicola TaxID=1852016 RepID=A0ABS3BQI1_9BACT|nr:cation:proton antiporter [Algoriphagus aestuariicola]MBN7801553.1 cation:proton antiporter [Algoriphagus aestuariicola]